MNTIHPTNNNRIITLTEQYRMIDCEFLYKKSMKFYFEMEEGMDLIDNGLLYLYYSVIYGDFRNSLAKKIINREPKILEKVPEKLVLMTFAIKDAFELAYKQIPENVVNDKLFNFSIEFNICATDIMKLNLYYALIPFTNSRKLLKYEKIANTYIKEIVALLNVYNKPLVNIVHPQTNDAEYFNSSNKKNSK